ncbi:tRNA epoxyqueuosine(34) reductase QueG [Anaerolinea thermophila]|uniref:Iron-sulfur binding protein n=1 Tax=Anaerolinea thermophila (strain DSM 14523 / JCM 11388 / NBRC 100420 / UNI-1) TaxID=926569 RepID=E8MYJ5_ANATU|nr:tRNA epoxyqueuosine(34) reductase QueG [Anaerolinea thermophila]BAJ64331.1 iron-sulfur binding protein [Anaerolinea thermophila UNI-1]
MSLETQIKQFFYERGANGVGITHLESPPHYPQYLQWVEAGLHGSMSYLDNERARALRGNPQAILPSARSVVFVSLPIASSIQSPPANRPLTGRVASYAWGEDYHLVFPKLFQAFVEWLSQQLGRVPEAKWYTDTGPVLERDLASRAGLGWIGKNTCLIHPRKGSFFLLGEIFLDVALEPDEPFKTDHCGTCTRCIEACPTECILPNRTLDASRCISYLTIENKGSIPRELREKMGNWVFGCDICQQVCPWNQRFGQTEPYPAFQPRENVPEPNLLEEIHLDSTGFNRKFKNSPVQRPRRRGYLRNVAVALGNAQDEYAVPALIECTENEPEPLVRQHAIWALGRYSSPRIREFFSQRLKEDNDEGVRLAIVQELER